MPATPRHQGTRRRRAVVRETLAPGLPVLGSTRSFSLAQSLPEQIAEQIAEAILEDRYPPGTRLKEIELSRAFAVSRAPVREALRLLETQKLVRIVPNRGAVVMALSVEELDELFAIRAVLMGLSMRKLAECGGDAEHTAFAARITEVEALLNAGDHVAYLRGLGHLSVFCAELAGPGWIRDLLVTTIHQTAKFGRRGLDPAASGRQVMAAWKQLLDAVRSRAADDAEASARELIMTAWSLVRPTLQTLLSPDRG